MNVKFFYVIIAIMMLGFVACSNEQSTENQAVEVESKNGTSSAVAASNESAVSETKEDTKVEAGVNVEEAKNKPKKPSELAEIDFENVTYSFGTVQEGEIVKHTFKFKNTGKVPLVIEKAAPSCGCTASDFSKEPIPPGGEGYVKAEFNSANRPGVANKSIRVIANTDPAETTLYVKGEVKGISKMNGPVRNP